MFRTKWTLFSAHGVSRDLVGNAFEYNQFQHGVITHILLLGLGGEPDVNHDSTVTTEELTSYLSRQCVAYSGSKSVAANVQYENNQEQSSGRSTEVLISCSRYSGGQSGGNQ